MPSRLFRDVLAEPNLWTAWEHCRGNRAAAGLDGVAVEHWEGDPEPELHRLASDLRLGRYRPWPLRRAWLPKRDGGRRPVAIGSLRDRVLQRAVLQCLAPRAEALFNRASFAYRPGRGVRDAVREIELWREAGFDYVLETDIDDCFDSLDWSLLLQRLKALVPEDDVRRLVLRWMRNEVVDRGTRQRPVRGVAQGDILSPLLCNLYLDPLDDALEQGSGRLVRYADDLIVLTRTRRGAERAEDRVRAELAVLNLEVNRHKTKIASFDEGFVFLGVEFRGDLAMPLSLTYTAGPDGVLRIRGEPRYELDLPPAPRPDPIDRRLGHLLSTAAARAARRGRDLPPMAEAFREALAERDQPDGGSWVL